jgi:glycosyltransferase involved in cell wall biosynthesis
MQAVTDLISIIVSTYNREDALDAVLRGLARQTDRNFEIVVADDGSGPVTAATIAGWQSALAVPVKHAWQTHRGFRAGEARNRAILASGGALCVFLDGDCVPRPTFVARHRGLAEPGWFVTGNRILLSPGLTAASLAEGPQTDTDVTKWSLAQIVARRAQGDLNRILPALTLPLGPLRRLTPQRWEGVRTCNMAVTRANLDRIDGFDARFAGWGLEDSDLAVRLLRAGVRRKDGRFATGVFHLWHPEEDRTHLADNQTLLDTVIGGKEFRAEQGMSKLAV